jgi:hypothetical protein
MKTFLQYGPGHIENENFPNPLVESFKWAEVREDPYKHLYIQNVFPWSLYWPLYRQIPEVYTDKSYENRMMCDVSNPIVQMLFTEEFKRVVMEKFEMSGNYTPYMRWVRDTPEYRIKPHTDIKKKAVTLLFYMPGDMSVRDYGTSVYVPKEKGFTSDGTRRFEFEHFEKVYTAPFVPNSVFGFKRADNSFHGVEQKGLGVRNVLLYNLLAT